MLMESLDARVLMAEVPLDPDFGLNGRMTVLSGRIEHVLATSDAIFLETTIDGGLTHTVYKYTSAGQLDTRWGSGGHTNADIDATQMAFDSRTGALYLAGKGDGTTAHPTLSVLRITKAGQIDTNFGVNGYAGYTAVSSDPDVRVTTTVTKLLPLAGGRVMVAFQRISEKEIGSSVSPRQVGEDEAVLMKLRANGTRDPGFARRGTLTVLGGSHSAFDADFYYGGTQIRPTILDLAASQAGVKVVLARSEFAYQSGSAPESKTDDETLQIKSQTVNSAGVVDPATAYSWTLLKAKKSEAGNTFGLQSIRYEGNDQITVVGTVKTFLPFDTTVFRVPTVTSQPYVFNLRPGVRITSAQLTAARGVTSVLRGTRGSFYGVTAENNVQKLTSKLRVDTRFANSGEASFGTRASFIFFTDADGRLLVADDDLLERVV